MSLGVEMLDFEMSSVTWLIRAIENVEFVKTHNYKFAEVRNYERIVTHRANRLRIRIIRMAMCELAKDRRTAMQLSHELVQKGIA